MQLSLWFEVEEIPSEEKASMEDLIQGVSESVKLSVDMPLNKEVIHVIIASDSLIQELNRDFRGKDSLTDVLSFPLGHDQEVTGEIYICWTRVISQAEDYGHSWQREFSYLLVHGVLHLLGYEHGVDPNPEMRELEEKILLAMEMGR